MSSAVFVFPASQSDAASAESRSVVSGVESSISMLSSSINDSTDIAQRSAVDVCLTGKVPPALLLGFFSFLPAPLLALLSLISSGFPLLAVDGLDDARPSSADRLDDEPPSPPRRLVLESESSSWRLAFEVPLLLDGLPREPVSSSLLLDGLPREPTEERDFLEPLESDCSLAAPDLRLRVRDLDLDRLDLGRDDERDLVRRPRDRLRVRLRDFGRRVASYREPPSMSRSFLNKGLLRTLFASAPGFAKPIIASARSVAR